jgi:voltage-gated potassium channel
MLLQLILATAAVLCTALFHLTGLWALTRMLSPYRAVNREWRFGRFSSLLVAITAIIAIHTSEIWTYAALYVGLSAFHHFEEALYFSTSTYASIGYGDVLLPRDWRILGAIEGAAGTIMLGWSTAYLVLLLTRLKLFGHVHMLR